MKISVDQLAEHMARLILGGATEVSLESLGGLTILSWRFPGLPGDCIPLVVEEACTACSC